MLMRTSIVFYRVQQLGLGQPPESLRPYVKDWKQANFNFSLHRIQSIGDFLHIMTNDHEHNRFQPGKKRRCVKKLSDGIMLKPFQRLNAYMVTKCNVTIVSLGGPDQ